MDHSYHLKECSLYVKVFSAVFGSRYLEYWIPEYLCVKEYKLWNSSLRQNKSTKTVHVMQNALYVNAI